MSPVIAYMFLLVLGLSVYFLGALSVLNFVWGNIYSLVAGLIIIGMAFIPFFVED
jgi:hypothetical protein